MSDAIPIYVLDTSAWLTLIEDEEGADVVAGLLETAKAGDIVVLVSFMSSMEVYYITIMVIQTRRLPDLVYHQVKDYEM